MKTRANSERAIRNLQTRVCEKNPSLRSDQRGFTMAELMIAMAVFTLIIGSVVTLLGKSQTIFRTEQGVSEMDQNARLLMDFLTRDIQQSKENALGLGSRFRSIYSYNGGRQNRQVTIISSDTESKLPSAALRLSRRRRNHSLPAIAMLRSAEPFATRSENCYRRAIAQRRICRRHNASGRLGSV
jgi:prepilin-type N-terminal cleavage/methylation domain-containing protein